MILSQLPKLLGYAVDTESLFTIIATPWEVPVFKELFLTLGVFISILLLAKFAPKLPATLFALFAATAVGYFFDVATIGEVALQLPSLNFSAVNLDVILALLGPASAIALVAYTDVMVAARAFTTQLRVYPSKEMFALAGTQLATGFAGGYPVSASTSRTALAKASGASSR